MRSVCRVSYALSSFVGVGLSVPGLIRFSRNLQSFVIN